MTPRVGLWWWALGKCCAICPTASNWTRFFGGTRTLRHALEPSHWTQRTWSLLLGFRSLPPNAGPGQRNPHQLTLNCNLVFVATCLFSPLVLSTHLLTQHFHLDKSNVRAVPRQRMCDQGRGGDTHPHRSPLSDRQEAGKDGCETPLPRLHSTPTLCWTLCWTHGCDISSSKRRCRHGHHRC